jgi:hypothetical protein
MTIVYKTYAYSDDKEIMGYDAASDGDVQLFTAQQLADIASKPASEQEAYALTLVPLVE